MLAKKKITIVGESVVNDAKIASFGAVIDVDADTMNFYHKHTDPEACKTHRNVVRADQATFEDFAYYVQEEVKAIIR
jgi:hypothetical protein